MIETWTDSPLKSADSEGSGVDQHRLVRHLDLFSGIGGFALAARMAGGIETVGFCEIDPWAQKVLAKNFPGVPIHNDVKTLKGNEYGAVELITGGYPCQPFSLAGDRKGAEDDRHLWPEVLRIVKGSRPRWVLCENVIGHVSMGLDQVLSDLEAEGYSCGATVLPACAVDARHRRDRVWVIANADGWGWNAQPLPSTRAQTRDGSAHAHCPDSANGRQVGWMVEPDLVRVVNGVSRKLDKRRITGLGNAIVPQVAAEILRCMMCVDSLANSVITKK